MSLSPAGSPAQAVADRRIAAKVQGAGGWTGGNRKRRIPRIDNGLVALILMLLLCLRGEPHPRVNSTILYGKCAINREDRLTGTPVPPPPDLRR